MAKALVVIATVACACGARSTFNSPRSRSPEVGLDSRAFHAERTARAALADAQFEQAALRSREALELVPASEFAPGRKLLLGLALSHLGRCEEAVPLLRDVAEAQDALARCLARLEHWGEATAAAERHARESPGEVAIAMLRRDIEDATAGKMTADEVANRAEARFYAALVDARLRARSSKPEARLASARLVCFCTDTGLLAEERSAAEDLLRRAYELDRYSSMAAFFDACVHFDAASSAQAIANQIAEVEAGLSVLARQRRVDAKHQDLKALEMTWTRAHQDLVERRWRGSVPKG